VAVVYGLPLTGGSRGVEDIQRMVERIGCELDRYVGFGQIRPSDGVGNGYAVEVWHGDQRREAREGVDDAPYVLSSVDLAPAVAIPVDGEQHLGFDLAETLEHRIRSEFGRAGRPHSPEGSGGEE